MAGLSVSLTPDGCALAPEGPRISYVVCECGMLGIGTVFHKTALCSRTVNWVLFISPSLPEAMKYIVFVGGDHKWS